jgi:GR25 family glycosyltransferase involved in LPS biosynthesis
LKLAPIAIFSYNRLDYLKILINSLKKNVLAKKSVVYIISDCWKNDYDKKEVLRVRQYIRKISGFKKIFIILRPKNFGLSKNIINGINFVLKTNKKIIVLEDDLKLSKHFLTYMNDALKTYNCEKKVASISGWSFPITFKPDSKDYFFIKGGDCWGWGTWKRAWKKFNPDAKKLLFKIKNKNLVDLFNLNNSFDYLKMLQDQIDKKNNSWAIRWYASTFLENMYTLYPKISFVQNMGTNYGTHSKFNLLNMGNVIIKSNYKPIIKDNIKEGEYEKIQIIKFFKKKFLFKLKELLKKILFR